MKHFLEELCIAALAWIPTAAGMGARLLLWRPLFKRCGRARFGTGIAMQGCKNMSLADGVRIGRGCQLYAEGGTLDMGEDAALSPGVTVDASGGLIRIGKQVAIGPGTVLRAANHCFDSLEKPIMLQGHLYGEIVIEDDVWIAANCTITPEPASGTGPWSGRALWSRATWSPTPSWAAFPRASSAAVARIDCPTSPRTPERRFPSSQKDVSP